MTAVAGLWRFDGPPDVARDCERMLGALSIYGPHGSALWSQSGTALGRRLHKLLPEDVHDRQPLVGSGGRYVLVADVRLDNRSDLIRALGIDAANARTLCDAALLLSAFERWQEDCFDRLVGDYAFALWDGDRRRLILARDPLGQRPLHFHRGPGFVAFASMPKGLHALGDIPYAPDEEQIAEFLALLPHSGSRTFFRGIERVEPGHFAIVDARGFSNRRHWAPERRSLKLASDGEYVEALRAHLDEAVRSRLRGIGDIGAQLSAGLDSSAVATTAARLLAPAGRRVVAFTGVPREGFDGPAPRGRINDEGTLAAATAAGHSNIDHVLVHGSGRAPLDDLDRNFHLFDQPMLNICNTGWVYNINDAVRDRRISVLLVGNMGNLTVSYDGMPLLSELVGRGRLLRWLREAGALTRNSPMRWRGVLARSFGPWLPAAAWTRLNRIANGSGIELKDYSAIHPQRVTDLDLQGRARATGSDFSYRPWKDGFDMRLWVLRRVDLGNCNKGVLAGWGIDQRDPTADRRLVEFCLAVPTEQFLKDGVPKSLARRALADRLPEQVLTEWRKGYQGADWHEQLTAARVSVAAEIERLTACRPAASALDLDRLRGLTENWPSGGWERAEVNTPYRLLLLRAISTGHFLRRASGANC